MHRGQEIETRGLHIRTPANMVYEVRQSGYKMTAFMNAVQYMEKIDARSSQE